VAQSRTLVLSVRTNMEPSYKFLATTRGITKRKVCVGNHRKVARRKKLPKLFWHATCRTRRANYFFKKRLARFRSFAIIIRMTKQQELEQTKRVLEFRQLLVNLKLNLPSQSTVKKVKKVLTQGQ